MALKTCTRPAGSVAAYGKVEIRLSQDTVITASGLNYLAAPIEVIAAADGSISVQLQANNDLTPNNTYYTVTEYAGVTDSTYYVQVPQTAGPFVLTAIQVSVPPAPAPVGAAHVASLLVDGAATVGGAFEALSSTSIDMLGTNQTITGVKSYSAAPAFNAGFTVSAGQVGAFGTGDLNNLTGSLPTTARSLAIYAGTAASPDRTVLAPLLKISRFQKYLDADAFGTNSDPTASAIEIDVSVDVASERQGIGVYSVVETYSTTTPASGKSADAFPFFGIGISAAGATHTGGGAYLEGRKLGTGGVAEGLEIHINNSSGSDDAFISTSFSRSAGIWLTSAGTNLVGVALSIGGQSPSQFDVGIGGTTYSGISGVKTAFIYDHTNAATSILIDNTHATAAIAVAAGANMTLLGGVASIYSNANALLELQGSNNFVDGLLAMGSVANLKTYTARIRNSSGQTSIGIIGVANDLITGSIAGDGVWRTSSANKFVHMGGTVSVVKVGNDNTLTLQPTVATAAGGALIGTLGNGTVDIVVGSGAPTLSARKGSLYLRTDGTTTNDRMYVNTNASTTWTAVTTAA